jgi:hypothetical protein
MKENIMSKHFKEMTAFKSRQRNEWNQLLKTQEATLAKEKDVTKLARDFTKQRDEHNKKFQEEWKEVVQRQQKELEEFKKTKQLQQPDKDRER